EGAARGIRFRVGNELEIEDLLPLAPHQRQRPVRRDLHERLEEVEIVGELRPRGLLAIAHFRDDPPASPEILAQPADELGVLGEALDEDRPGAVESLLRGLDRVRLHVRFGLCKRLALGMGEKRLGERIEAILARDLRLGAAFRLEWQVDVLEPRLGVGLVDPGLERGVELALLADRIEDRFAPVFELAQVGEAGLERPQLRVVERPGRLLAVAGDEGHGRASVQKADCGGDLAGPDVQLFGDGFGDGFHVASESLGDTRAACRGRRRAGQSAERATEVAAAASITTTFTNVSSPSVWIRFRGPRQFAGADAPLHQLWTRAGWRRARTPRGGLRRGTWRGPDRAPARSPERTR